MVQYSGHTLRSHLSVLWRILSKPSGMQHNGPVSRSGKPSTVQCFLRLTGSQKIPFTVTPQLHPGMVVVTMGPEGCINLAGRNSYAAQSSHSKSRFFSAASCSGTIHGSRVLCPSVCRAVGCLPGTPIIHIYSCLIHGTGRSCIQIHSFINAVMKKSPCIGDILVIYSVMQHIIGKKLLRHTSCKRTLIPQEYAVFCIGQE